MQNKGREYFIVTTTVTDIIEKKNYGNKYKTTFLCKSNTKTQRVCIFWANSNIKIGDNIEMKGFFANAAFIVKSLFII